MYRLIYEVQLVAVTAEKTQDVKIHSEHREKASVATERRAILITAETFIGFNPTFHSLIG